MNEKQYSFSSRFLAFAFFLFLFFRIDSVLIFGDDYNLYYFFSFLIFFFFFKAKFYLFSPAFYLILLLFNWMYLVLVYDYFFVQNLYGVTGKSQLDLRFNIFSNAVVFFAMGYVFFQNNILCILKNHRVLFLFLFLVTVCMFFLHFNGKAIDYVSISNSMSHGWVNHLYFGSAVVLLSAVTLALFSGSMRFFLFFVVFFLLFFLGGGSAFVIFVISFFMVYLFFVFRENITLIIVPIILIFFTLPVFLYNLFHNDASFLDRIYLFSVGLPYINDQLFIGKPELILQYAEGYGSYFHNFLSMIQFFGLFPLCLLFIVYCLFFYKSLLIVRSSKKVSSLLFLFLFLLFYSFLSLLVSKFIAEWIVWFSIGFCSASVMSKKSMGEIMSDLPRLNYK